MLKQAFKISLMLFLIILGIIVGYRFSISNDQAFKSLSPEKMYETIIAERDYAIQKAVERGDYRCCIKPPCTMCYLEANQWNNFKAGTCACDDLIAQGKEPCPQCRNGLCKEEEKWFCKGN